MIRYPHALRFNTKFLAVTSAIILALILATFLPVRASAVETNIVRLNMKSYGNHNATYDARIMEIKPQFVIDNPAHGLYGEMFGYNDSTLLQNVAGYQSAGIKVIGYITGGYEGRGGDDGYAAKWYSLDMQKKMITNMATLDHVDGVFIDEISDYPNTASKAYLKELTTLAHSYGLITWGNTGVDQFDEWFFMDGGFDYMQSSENWIGQTLSPVQKKWGSRISVTGFNRNYTVDDAVRLTLDAWNKGLAFAYINTVEYVSIASWFEQYANILRTNGGTVSSTPTTPTPAPAPTPTPTPTPTPSPTPTPTPSPTPAPTSGNTTGTVVGTPKSSGGTNEYNFSFKVTSSTVTGITTGQQIWVAATTTDFPNLLTSGATLTGNLDKSPGWWVLKKASTSTTTPIPPPTSTTVSGNTTATVASKPVSSGGSKEYNLSINVTSTTVTGVTAGKQLWVAATTTDFPNLLTVGTVITGNLDNSLGWWVFSKA